MKLACKIRYLFAVLVVLAGMSVPPFSLSAEEKPKDGTTTAPPAKEQKTTLIQIYSWATILPKELIDLQTD